FASLPAIAYANRHSSWRNIYLLTSLPALIYSVVVFLFVKESPRWMQLRRSTYSGIRTLLSSQWARRRMALVTGLTFGLGMAYCGMPLVLGSLSFNLYLSVAMEALIELPSVKWCGCRRRGDRSLVTPWRRRRSGRRRRSRSSGMLHLYHIICMITIDLDVQFWVIIIFITYRF
ncbi:hypothetical protein V2J09_016095, partial [Rumex salicifolius]